MDNIRKIPFRSNSAPTAGVNASRNQVSKEMERQKSKSTTGSQDKIVKKRENEKDISPVTYEKKRARSDDFAEGSLRAIKRSEPQASFDKVENEILIRIKNLKDCSEAYDSAKVRNAPEIFVDTKIKGRRTLKVGRDISSYWVEYKSRSEFGQVFQHQASWGRMFLVIPSLQKVEILENFSSIFANKKAMHFFNKLTLISELDSRQSSLDSEIYSAPARLDLMFRFGIFSCKRNVEIAETMKALIPGDKLNDAYSYAMQSAVHYNELNLIRYCLSNGASPISPEEDNGGFRELSPIEIAFAVGTAEVQDLMLNNIKKNRDLIVLKELFLDVRRWQAVPPKMSKLFKEMA